MKNIRWYLLLLLTIITLTACSKFSDATNLEYFTSENEAILNGIDEKDTLLSVEEFNGNSLVFFENDEALGVAILHETSGKFTLVRENPLFGFEGGSDYSTIGIKIDTIEGKNIEILAGKVLNMSVQKIILEDYETKERFEIWDRNLYNTNLFYYILGDKHLRKNVIAIIN